MLDYWLLMLCESCCGDLHFFSYSGLSVVLGE